MLSMTHNARLFSITPMSNYKSISSHTITAALLPLYSWHCPVLSTAQCCQQSPLTWLVTHLTRVTQ